MVAKVAGEVEEEVMAAVMVEVTAAVMAAAAMVVVVRAEATAGEVTEAAARAVGATEEVEMEEATVVVAMVAVTAVRHLPHRRNSGPRGLSPTDRTSIHQNRHHERRRGAPRHMSAHTAPIPTPAPHRDRSRCADLQAARVVCIVVRHIGGSEPRPQSTWHCVGSRPYPHSSCRTRRASRRMPSRAASI